MRIFILDKVKITKYNLPNKIEDSFLVPYNGYDNIKDNYITVEATEDKWQLKSNGTVNIVDGVNILETAFLDNYSFYNLKVLGQTDCITLFAMPTKEEETYKLQFKNLNVISIGSSVNCNISYKNELTDKLHAEIKFINNEWYISSSVNEDYKTYVNGEKIVTAKLNVGDVIFINGLRIIWMKEFIKINNPQKSITVIGMEIYDEGTEFDNTKYNPVSDEDSSVNLYNEDDYFYHVPRVVPVITPEDISIDPPPSGENKEELPFLLTIGTSITMFASSGIMIYNVIISIMNGRPITQLIPQIVMAFSLVLGSLIMPRVLKAYEKRRRKKREKERQEKYKAYLDKMNTKIQYALKNQAQILKENNISSKECYDIIINKSRKFWSRELYDDDFMKIKLGNGDIDSFVKVQAPKEHFSLNTDNLQELVYEVDEKSKKLINVPVVLDFSDKTILSFIMNCSYSIDYINGLLTQLLALHSALDLKIALFTTKQNEKRWDFIRFLPHCWSDDKQKRFFATTPDEHKDLSAYLMEEFEKRKDMVTAAEAADPVTQEDSQRRNSKQKKVAPYYLIITDDYRSIDKLSLIHTIQSSIINYGFSILTISETMKNIPNRCERFVQIGEKESCIFDRKLSSKSQRVFTNEYLKNIDMNAISVKLSNVPLLTKDALSEFPAMLSFLDMYGVGKIEQLNIINRWQVNSPVSTLSTTIGVHEDGQLFKLDLHEKFHGPHGLIAGATGSGKSEFIITYILSMCVNYHPYEVQFVLIDYKGGGLAGAFENKETGVKIPHLVGTITNLDTAEMNRTLVSISSELKRRQRKFNEVKDKLDESTMDIYKYQKFYREGLIEEPMAHLFIISDEFAELKSQQPEFLTELVSTARIGRSLGVHLILATQKPSGVVNDQIWSNSKFKVCLKVQDRSDSMEMLKRPEAASIKDVGRFYLQVGYDDYFDIGQSGWGGAKYVPTDRIIKKIDDSINYVNNIGDVIKSVNDITKKETNEDLGDQLTNIVKYIHRLSEKENIVTRKMWLDKIPEYIYINEIKKKYNYSPKPYLITPVIGELDNPAAQSQNILNLNLQNNVLIYGKGGSGKENLISTILWSSIVEHTPDEVSFYIIDCGAETLKMFYKMPHVGEVMTVEEKNKIFDFFNMISKEIDRRKDEYADYAGNYVNYCENSGNKDPLIVTIINGYETFSESYGKLAEQIQTLYRDGAKYGVTFVISCIAANTLRQKTTQYFAEKIALQMPNKDDYRSVMSAPKGLIPSSIFGRGLIEKNSTAFEFQTAYICEPKEISNVIREASKQLSSAYTTKARKIPTIPQVVTLDSFKDQKISLNSFPIGFELLQKTILNYDFSKSKINSIVSEDMHNRVDFIKAIIKQLSSIENVNVKIVDFVNALESENIDSTVYNSNFDNAVVEINNEIATESKSDRINYYVFIGIGEYESELSAAVVNVFNNLLMASNNFSKSYFLFIDNYSSYRKLQLVDWYKSRVDTNRGIWLGANVSNQMAFSVGNLSMEVRNLNLPYMAFVLDKNSFSVIKYVVDKEEENEK